MSAEPSTGCRAGRPPEHVCATFGLHRVPEPVGAEWDGGWRCGDVVLSPVLDHARAAWSAKVREALRVDGVRLARPVRATDGRYVVSGWRADTFLVGRPEPRYDEMVAAAVNLHRATESLERPRFLSHGPVGPWLNADVFVIADRAAWDIDSLKCLRVAQGSDTAAVPATPDGQYSLELIGMLSKLRHTVRTPSQLVHGDLFGTVLFAGTALPGLTDITPYWRPAPWAAAVAVVDALSWGGADDGLLERWEDQPEWPQMVLRAVLFRLAVHALHPRSTTDALIGLARTAEMVRFMV